MEISFSDRRHGKCQWVWCVQRARRAYPFKCDEEQQQTTENDFEFHFTLFPMNERNLYRIY